MRHQVSKSNATNRVERQRRTHLGSLNLLTPSLHLAAHALPVLEHEAAPIVARQLLVRVPPARAEALEPAVPCEALARGDVERRVDFVGEVEVIEVLRVALGGALRQVLLELRLLLLGRQVGERSCRDGRRLVSRRVDKLGLLFFLLLVLLRSATLGLHRVVVFVLLEVAVLVLVVVDDPRRLVSARALRDLLQLGRRPRPRRRGHLGAVACCGRRRHLLLGRPRLLVEAELVVVGDVSRRERVGVVVRERERVEGRRGGRGSVDRHRLGGCGRVALRRAAGRGEEDLLEQDGVSEGPIAH